jgi:1-aminocyclopropane-1-carboxylate deaminase
MIETVPPSTLQELSDPRWSKRGVRLMIKRDDLVHPVVRGNKWRKLKYNLEAWEQQGWPRVLTFGGAYSNHLYALAAAGRQWRFHTVGVVRGEEHLPLNPVLAHALDCGMEIVYLDRDRYRDKHRDKVVAELHERLGQFVVLPEGGSNCLALLGAAEIVSEVQEPFDVIAVPCGTGGTLAGRR